MFGWVTLGVLLLLLLITTIIAIIKNKSLFIKIISISYGLLILVLLGFYLLVCIAAFGPRPPGEQGLF